MVSGFSSVKFPIVMIGLRDIPHNVTESYPQIFDRIMPLIFMLTVIDLYVEDIFQFLCDVRGNIFKILILPIVTPSSGHIPMTHVF